MSELLEIKIPLQTQYNRLEEAKGLLRGIQGTLEIRIEINAKMFQLENQLEKELESK